MAYSAVTLPLTGAGDVTAAPAVDVIDGKAYQAMKIMDGTEGSTVPVPAFGTTPGSTDHGLVTRPIASTAFNQAVVGSVGITSGSSAVDLTSAGSTRLVGRVAVENPSTSVDISNQPTVDLSSVGSTKLVGRVDVNNPTTSVTVTSGVVLGAGSSANTIGNVTVSNLSTGGGGSTTVDANLTSAGSTKIVGTVNVSSGVVLGAGSSANTLGNVTVSNLSTGGGGSTVVDANLTSAGSTRIIGIAVDRPFSSGSLVITTANSSADVALLAANENRSAAIIANGSTGTALLVSFSTAVVSSAGPYTFQVPALGYVSLGGVGGFIPNYRGPIRGKMNSTVVAGPVFITEFTS